MPKRKRKEPPSDKRPVPAYMMCFANLMTLLLTFLLLFLTLGQTQESGFKAGTGSFITALESAGLPGILPGRRYPVGGGVSHPNYTPEQRDVEKSDGSPDPLPELLRPRPERIRQATVDPLPRAARAVPHSVAIAFRPGTDQLTPGSLAALDRAADLAQRALADVRIEAHVAGPRDGWQLSALRAAAVARVLHDRGGVAYERITLVGCGRFHPLAAAPANRVSFVLSSRSPH